MMRVAPRISRQAMLQLGVAACAALLVLICCALCSAAEPPKPLERALAIVEQDRQALAASDGKIEQAQKALDAATAEKAKAQTALHDHQAAFWTLWEQAFGPIDHRTPTPTPTPTPKPEPPKPAPIVDPLPPAPTATTIAQKVIIFEDGDQRTPAQATLDLWIEAQLNGPSARRFFRYDVVALRQITPPAKSEAKRS